MHNDYKDIISRIEEEPTWWDNNGVPRFGEFKPENMPDIYSEEVALYLIECQSCGHPFKVAESLSVMDKMRMMHSHLTDEQKKERFDHKLSDEIKAGYIHYGDPPNIGCCAAGATMNCMDIKVLEYWRRENFEWLRDSEFETPLSDYEERQNDELT